MYGDYVKSQTFTQINYKNRPNSPKLILYIIVLNSSNLTQVNMKIYCNIYTIYACILDSYVLFNMPFIFYSYNMFECNKYYTIYILYTGLDICKHEHFMQIILNIIYARCNSIL